MPFYVGYEIQTTRDDGLAPFQYYGTTSIAITNATPVSAQIVGSSNSFGAVTLNTSTGTAYVYSNAAGKHAIRVLYIRK